MSKNLPNKIVITSLCEKFSNEIAKLISEDLNLLFCNSNELVEYELIDRKAVEELASLKYVQEIENKVLENLSTYENVCISLSYEHLIKFYKRFSKNGIIIFLDLPKNYIKKNSPISFLDYVSRKEELQKFATVEVKVHKLDFSFVKDKTLKILGGIL